MQTVWKLSLLSMVRAVFLMCLMSSAPSLAQICSTDPDVAIPQGSGTATPGGAVSADIVVPASPGTTVVDMNFGLQIDHTYVGDLIVTLTSPAGTTITLMDRPRSIVSPPYGCSGNNVDLTFDDSSGTLIEDQCDGATPAISGTHQPTGSLSAFFGEPVSGTWTVTVTDNAGGDLGTLISSGSCVDFSSTPVTISSFKSKRKGKYLKANWQTSSESFNLGFHLWGNVEGDWQQLNKRLIASDAIDSVAPQSYKHRINLVTIDGDVTGIGISSVSASGQEEFYGPFGIGDKYGELAVPEYLDWGHQRALYDQSMQDAGYIKIKQRWVKNNRKREARQQRQAERFPDVILDISKASFYRLSYEELLTQGIDLKGMPTHKLALTRAGNAIPRAVVTLSGQKSKRFGPGSSIIFYGYGPSDSDSRYVGVEPYRISLDASKVMLLSQVDGIADSSLVSLDYSTQHHRYTEKFGSKNRYSFGVEGDGWYDSHIRAVGSIGVKTISLDVSEDAILDELVTVELSMFGVTSFPKVDADGDGEVEDDHHYKVYLNRSEYPGAIAEGYANGQTFITVSETVVGQLKHGANDVQIELIPDNGHNIDLVYFVDGSVSYQRPNTLLGTALSFVERGDGNHTILETNGVDVDAVYAVDSQNNVAAKAFKYGNGLVDVSGSANASQRGDVSLTFVSRDGYATPDKVYKANEITLNDLDLSDVDYVVIADASLRGDTLQRFVARQVELGRRTKVVTSQAIFDAYSSGKPVPQAIADYLAIQSVSSPFKYVLLVGGHTYNYRGYNTDDNNQPINLIPSFYRGTESITRQIPTAVPFVDFDNDGAPDRAIGRWPVRDLNQLEFIVDKTLAWHADGSHKNSKTSLFIADGEDEQNNFTGSNARLIPYLGLDLNPWQVPTEISLDVINADSSIESQHKLSRARDRIVDAVNQGPALTVYSGHGSPSVWGRQALVSGVVSDRFNNVAAPTLMVPLACYTTYYETPNVKSLPEVLLTDSAAGGVAITGAALLSRSGDNQRFGRDLLKKMTVSGLDLGSAVLSVKREIHKISPRHQTVVYNWVTLGDPTLSFDLPKVVPLPTVNQPKGVITD